MLKKLTVQTEEKANKNILLTSKKELSPLHSMYHFDNS